MSCEFCRVVRVRTGIRVGLLVKLAWARMRLSIPVALPRRVPGDGNPPNAPRASQWTLCCPLAHLLVVVANSVQLFLMVCFLFLLLWKLNDVGIYSWFWVFAPLWASDAITMLTSTFELRRCYNMQSIGHT